MLVLFYTPETSVHVQSSEPQSTPEPENEISSQDGSSASEAYTYNEAYDVIDRLNEGLPAPSSTPNQEMPQTTVEHFGLSCDINYCEDASVTLNFNLLQRVKVGVDPPV